MSLTPDELLSRLRGLIDAYRAVRDPLHAGEGNLRCDKCVDCNRCRFCVQCVRCEGCSNCERCEDCVRCTRSRGSKSCSNSSFIEFSESCEDSQYLVLCVACVRCEQCFACVGLEGESYCILNQRYTRKEYFVVSQALKKRLEEEGPKFLAELAAASRGRWTADPQGVFTVAGGVVRGVVDGSVVPEPEDDDPWIDGVVPARVE